MIVLSLPLLRYTIWKHQENLVVKTESKPEKYTRKREVILDGALEMFSTHGVESTGLKEIANHLGLTHPALYHYFRSKEQIVFEAVKKAMLDLISDLEQSQIGLPDTASIKLMNLCQAHVIHEVGKNRQTSFVNAFIYGPLKQSSSLDDGQYEQILELQRKIFSFYSSIVSQGQQTGEFVEGSSSIAAFGVLGMISYTIFWYREDGPQHKDSVARSLAAQALRSVAK